MRHVYHTQGGERVDKQKIIKAIEDLLDALGEDRTRVGLQETSRRVAEAYAELLSGEDKTAEIALSKTFDVSGDDIVIEKDITFSSTCEHHLMPFFGRIAVAYIPDGRVVGLSKLARAVEVYSHRLQLQEQLTAQIADAVMEYLKPKGVLVWCEAEHTCMTCRGVRKPGTKTTTYCTRGEFTSEKVMQVLAVVK